MPLYKKKELELIPFPDVPPSRKIWFLKLTCEAFTSYDEYTERLRLLNSRVFACSMTGCKNLKYAEALRSEQKQEGLISSLIKDHWVKPLVQIIHYNTSTLLEIVEQLYNYFSKTYLPGDYVNIENEKKDKNVFLVKKMITSSECQTLNKDKGKNSEYIFMTNGLNDGYFYILSPSDESSVNKRFIFIVHESLLKRSGFAPPKKSFSRIVKAMAKKDIWVGAPWILREYIIKKYNLEEEIAKKEISASLLNKKPRPNRRQRPASKKLNQDAKKDTVGGIRVKNKSSNQNAGSISKPASSTLTKRPAAKSTWTKKTAKKPKVSCKNFKKSNVIVSRPVPCIEFGKIPQNYTGLLVETWSFLMSFTKLLDIKPITFDQFVDDISSDYSDHIPDSISKYFSSILSLVCYESSEFIPFIKKQLGLPCPKLDKQVLSNLPDKYFIDERGIIFHKSSYGIIRKIEESDLIVVSDAHSGNLEKYPNEEKERLKLYIANYNKLNTEKRDILDLWYTWKIRGKSSYEKYEETITEMLKVKKKGPHWKSDRVGWELSLVGFVRDCITIEQWPQKWDFINDVLCLAISNSSDVTSTNESETSQFGSSKTFNELSKVNESSLFNQKNDDVQNKSVARYNLRKAVASDENDDNDTTYQSRLKGFGLRKRNRNITYNPVYNESKKSKSSKILDSQKGEQKKWIREVSPILRGCRICLNALSVTTRLFLLHFLTKNVTRGKKLRDFIDYNRDIRKKLLKMKRMTEIERRYVASMKTFFLQKRVRLEKEAFKSTQLETPILTENGALDKKLLEEKTPDVDIGQINKKVRVDDTNIRDINGDYNLSKEEDDCSIHHSDTSNKKRKLEEDFTNSTGNNMNIKLESEISDSTDESAKLKNHKEANINIGNAKFKNEESYHSESVKIDDQYPSNNENVPYCDEQIKNLTKKEGQLLRKENLYKQVLSKTASAKSITMLGRDKHYNRYWWFDEQLGCPPMKNLTVEQTDSNDEKISESDNDYWICGYLFVEIVCKTTAPPEPQSETTEHKIKDADGHKYDDGHKENGALSNNVDDSSKAIKIDNFINNNNKIDKSIDNVVNGMLQSPDPNGIMQNGNHADECSGSDGLSINDDKISSSFNENKEIIKPSSIHTLNNKDALDSSHSPAITTPSSGTSGKSIDFDDVDNEIPKFKSGTWAFYDQAAQVEHLLKWLSHDTPTESHLYKELLKLKDLIMFRMNKRKIFYENNLRNKSQNI